MRPLDELESLLAQVQRSDVDPWVLDEQLGRARELARACRRSVSPSQVLESGYHPPPKGWMIQPTLAPDTIVTLETQPTIAPGDDSPAQNINLNIAPKLWIVGFRATASVRTLGALSAGAVEQSLIGLKMGINGETESIIVSPNRGPLFAPLSDLCVPGVQWSPLMRRVTSTDVLTVTFRSFAPVGGPDLTVSFAVGVRLGPYPGSSTD